MCWVSLVCTQVHFHALLKWTISSSVVLCLPVGSEAPLGGREVLCLGVHCRAPSWPMSQVSFSLLRKTGLQSGCLYKPLSAWVPETALAPGVSMPGVVTAPHVHKQKIMALLLSGSLNSIHLIYKCSLHLTHWSCAICWYFLRKILFFNICLYLFGCTRS